MDAFSQRLRERARALGLSDAEVARRAGLSERRYGYYATGEREPNLATLVRICHVLGVTPNELLLPGKTLRPPSDRARLNARIHATINGLSEDDLAIVACQMDCLLAHRISPRRRRQLARAATV
jgi:transcriptional regulator with XRE-family HTH domain